MIDPPPFAAPWQARAFALAVRLSEQGHFTWPEFSHHLAATVKKFPDESYYEQWLRALEEVVAEKEVV